MRPATAAQNRAVYQSLLGVVFYALKEKRFGFDNDDYRLTDIRYFERESMFAGNPKGHSYLVTFSVSGGPGERQQVRLLVSPCPFEESGSNYEAANFHTTAMEYDVEYDSPSFETVARPEIERYLADPGQTHYQYDIRSINQWLHDYISSVQAWQKGWQDGSFHAKGPPYPPPPADRVPQVVALSTTAPTTTRAPTTTTVAPTGFNQPASPQQNITAAMAIGNGQIPIPDPEKTSYSVIDLQFIDLPALFPTDTEVYLVTYAIEGVQYTYLFDRNPVKFANYSEVLDYEENRKVFINFDSAPQATRTAVNSYLADPNATHYIYDIKYINNWLGSATK